MRKTSLFVWSRLAGAAAGRSLFQLGLLLAATLLRIVGPLTVAHAQAPTPGPVPIGLFTITLADGTPITGPIPLTPGLTLKATLAMTSSNLGSQAPVVPVTWAWELNHPDYIDTATPPNIIPGTAQSLILAITQAGKYSVLIDFDKQPEEIGYEPRSCRCNSQVVEVFDSPSLHGQPLNYAVETTVLKPGTTAAQLATLSPAERRVTQTLADGLGRALQTVQQQAAPDQADVVSFQQYDTYGQTSTAYLPYTRTPAAGSLPFSSDPVSEQATFYTATPKVAADTRPLATATFEASPLARPQQQTPPGRAWQGHVSSHAASQLYDSNGLNQVHRWDDLDGSGFYAPQALAKETRRDADGHRQEIFRDEAGRTVLQRQWNQQTAHDTYSVYDAVGHLRYLVPPAAVNAAAAFNYNITDSAFVKRWLYQYDYDEQGRLVSRSFPGAEPVAFVYDRFDRLVLTQDGNRRQANSWYFTKYDAQGRPAVEGLVGDGRDRATLQAEADAWTGAVYEQRQAGGIGYSTETSYPVVSEDTSTGTAFLSVSFYDDYDLDQDASAAPDAAYRAQDLGADEPIATDHTQGRLTATRQRVVLADGTYGEWLTAVNFYDTYGHVIQTQSNSLLAPGVTLPNVTTVVYREHGYVPQVLRSIKTQESPDYGIVQVRTRFAYGPAGHLLRVWQQNTWREQVEKEVLVASYAYNALDQLVEKNLHSQDDGATFLQSVDLRYNIQGALTSINNPTLTADGLLNDDADDVFGLQLVREAPDADLTSTPRFDGGISAVRWQTHNARQHQQPERQRAYTFAYDGLGRLTDAAYAARDARSGAFSAEAGAYDEKGIAYDANGNIQSLTRTTQAADGVAQREIDRLAYTYDGNRLLAVDDNADATTGFRDGTRGGTDYQYDAAGSVTADANKHVNFAYNVLNKVAVQKTNVGKIRYTYDAAGTVLRRTVSNTQMNTIQQFDYVDGFVFSSDGNYKGLLSVPTSEGRAVVVTTPAESGLRANTPLLSGPATEPAERAGSLNPAGPPKHAEPDPASPTTSPLDPTRLVYEYHLRDHLGNLRVAFRAEVLQERQTLQMEDVAKEEGPYPAFENVKRTQTTAYAYEGTHSAAVTANNPGPATLIPVVAGDGVKVDFFYLIPTGLQTASAFSAPVAKPRRFPLVALAPVLIPAPSAYGAGENGSVRVWPGLQLSLSGLLSRQASRLIPTPPTEPSPDGPAPAAYVGWTLYNAHNEAQRSGTVAVPTIRGSEWSHFSTTIPVDVNLEDGKGSLRVQLLNEGNQAVYFDSVSIRHPRAGLLVSQENHYYPFGMNLKGVALNTAPTEAPSKSQFNGGSQLQDELLGDEAGIYSTPYRSYDPTVGRFQGVDPLADKYAGLSPYNFSANGPVNANDPSGADPRRLSAATVRMAMRMFESTPENGSAYWSPEAGASFFDARTTMENLLNGVYNDLPRLFGEEHFNGGGGSAHFGSFADGHGEVGAHNVAANLAVTVKGYNPLDSPWLSINLTVMNWMVEHQVEIEGTLKALPNMYTGYQEMNVSTALLLTPEPTMATKVAGVYTGLDGAIRFASTPIEIIGIWTDWDNNTNFSNVPTNLLGVVGYVANGTANGTFYMGSHTQILMTAAGDFIEAKRTIISGTGKSLRQILTYINTQINTYNSTYSTARKLQF